MGWGPFNMVDKDDKQRYVTLSLGVSILSLFIEEIVYVSRESSQNNS